MKDKTHLFKWTDKSVVEEIDDFQDVFDVLLAYNCMFQSSLTTCESLLKRHVSKIEELEDAIASCQEKNMDFIRQLSVIKSMFVCCFVMVFMYLIYA
ncbi:unnamed protein product [Eruca vesicaria subsp. sativa]|uniref:Uncharacterized protein n=1 Tax=Eruca vesicaria subsp. sativa TaxID=29727 RepID=A0ABC8L644_ERUVS|nr:unnamed protein product [Eruca vesicaria subsp. sativa]